MYDPNLATLASLLGCFWTSGQDSIFGLQYNVLFNKRTVTWLVLPTGHGGRAVKC